MRRLAMAIVMAAVAAIPATFLRAADGVVENVAPVSVHGRVDAVTVYRGQALVTRVVDLPGGPGLAEIVVTDLPDRVIAGSLFAESGDGVEVRSIRYRVRPVAQDVRQEVRQFDDQIRQLQDQIASTQSNMNLQAQENAYLDKLEQFSAPTANAELTKGVLNAETLKTLTQFIFSQRQSVAETQQKLQLSLRDLQENLNLQQRQRDEVTGGSARQVREAVIFVDQKAPKGKLNVRYVVDGATWDPSYNIRADRDRNGATVEYNGAIAQLSGEDWTDVTMTLSTATPSLVANAPVLAPLSIALEAQAVNSPQAAGLIYGQIRDELSQKRYAAESMRNFQASAAEQAQSDQSGAVSGNAGEGNPGTISINGKRVGQNDVELNRVADQLQVLELVTREQKPEEETDHAARQVQEGIVVTYQLASRTSLPSRSDRQMIQIASLPMKGEFYKMAIPVLTNYVYDEAAMTNTSNMVLLAGPVASYMAGQFVGSGEIPTVAVGQPFTAGFGIDASLRATRERVSKTEEIQGGNKVLGFTYRLAVENFGSAPAQVRLMDRLPTAKDTEVKITFDSPDVELSHDKEYEMTDRKSNILRWDVSVPAQKNGTESFALQYQLHMEYDKNMGIANLPILKLQESK
jgi:hypothetical protein